MATVFHLKLQTHLLHQLCILLCATKNTLWVPAVGPKTFCSFLSINDSVTFSRPSSLSTNPCDAQNIFGHWLSFLLYRYPVPLQIFWLDGVAGFYHPEKTSACFCCCPILHVRKQPPDDVCSGHVLVYRHEELLSLAIDVFYLVCIVCAPYCTGVARRRQQPCSHTLHRLMIVWELEMRLMLWIPGHYRPWYFDGPAK